MSYDSSSYFLEKSKTQIFSSWVVTNIPEIYLKTQNAKTIINWRVDGIWLISRPWHLQFSDTLTGWTFPKGITAYLRASSANDRLIVNHNAGLISITEAWVQTAVTNTITADVRMDFTNIGDVLYCMNWTDEYGKLSWTTYTEPQTLWIINSVVISFSDSDPDTITEGNNLFLAKWFKSWDTITVSWSTSNDWNYTIDTVTASIITLISWDSLTNEWTGASVTITATGFTPSFWVHFDKSHWASWISANSNTLYKSVTDNPDNFSLSWSDQFTFPEQIKWLASNDEQLFVFTNSTINQNSGITDVWGTAVYTFRQLETKEWAVNHASIVAAGNDVYYLTPNNKIKRVTPSTWRPFETLEVSHKKFEWIDEIMTTLDNDQTDSFGYFIPEENLIKWHVRTKDVTFNNLCLVYNIELDLWLIDTNKIFFEWTIFKNKAYVVSNLEKKIFQDETWFEDDEEPVQFQYRKLWRPTWNTRRFELWETRTLLEMNKVAQITQNIIIDWNTVNTFVYTSDLLPISTTWIWTQKIWTVAVWTWWAKAVTELFDVTKVITKGWLQVKWKTKEIEFKASTVGWQFRLLDYDFKVEQLPVEAVS